jgi:hypothetical protein
MRYVRNQANLLSLEDVKKELKAEVPLGEPTLECKGYEQEILERIAHFVGFYKSQLTTVEPTLSPENSRTTTAEPILSPEKIADVDEILRKPMMKCKLLRFWVHTGYSLAYRMYIGKEVPEALPYYLTPPQFLIGTRGAVWHKLP